MTRSARSILALTAIAITGTMMIQPTQAAPLPPVREICRYQFEDGRRGWSPNEATHAIRCAFQRFAPSQMHVYVDGLPKPLYIARRESGFSATAKNPNASSACRWIAPYGSCGLFQHLMRYWQGRVYLYGRRAWFPWSWPRVPILNARANALITARMVAAGGWGPWGG